MTIFVTIVEFDDLPVKTIVSDNSGKQILLNDLAGNAIELFESPQR